MRNIDMLQLWHRNWKRPPSLEGAPYSPITSTYPCITGRNLFPYIRYWQHSYS